MSGNDDFLSRWSRRKHAAAVEPDEPEAVSEDVVADAGGDAEEAASVETEGVEELSDAEILEKYDLKDPDELGPGDDFAGFMRAAVPEHLRRRALRTLWRSNPILANLDGLNDYDGDWTGGSVAAGELKTAYKVGMGFVRDVAEAVSKVEPAEKPAEANTESDSVKTAPPMPEAVAAEAENTTSDDTEPDEFAEESRLATRKRMVFTVTDT